VSLLLTSISLTALAHIPVFREPNEPRPILLPIEQALELQDLATDGRALIGLFSKQGLAHLRVWNAKNELVLSAALLPHPDALSVVSSATGIEGQCLIVSRWADRVGPNDHNVLAKPDRMTVFALDGTAVSNHALSKEKAALIEESSSLAWSRSPLHANKIYAPLWQPNVALPKLDPAVAAMQYRPFALRDTGESSYQLAVRSSSRDIALVWNNLSLSGLSSDGPVRNHDDGAWWLRYQQDGTYRVLKFRRAIEDCLLNLGTSLDTRIVTVSLSDGEAWVSCFVRQTESSTLPIILRVSVAPDSIPVARVVGGGLIARWL